MTNKDPLFGFKTIAEMKAQYAKCMYEARNYHERYEAYRDRAKHSNLEDFSQHANHASFLSGCSAYFYQRADLVRNKITKASNRAIAPVTV